jgi:dTDP-4-dehydrorhamnose reductase
MLAKAVAEALVLHRLTPVGVDLPHCDISSRESVQRTMAQLQPQVVFNCAAFTKVDACETNESAALAVNATGVENLALACREAAAKLVHISTDFVFDELPPQGPDDGAAPQPSARRPLRPNDPTGPRSAYGRTKLRGEQLLAEVDPPGWLIARTAWLYGPGGASFPRTIVERARQGHPLRVVSDQHGSPTYTLDLAAVLVELVEKDATGIFHVTNSGDTTWHGFATEALREFAVPAEVEAISTEQYRQMAPHSAARPAYSVLDCSLTEAAIGRPLRPWRLALAEFAARVRSASTF